MEYVCQSMDSEVNSYYDLRTQRFQKIAVYCPIHKSNPMSSNLDLGVKVTAHWIVSRLVDSSSELYTKPGRNQGNGSSDQVDRQSTKTG